jgi:hypothetical protein
MPREIFFVVRKHVNDVISFLRDGNERDLKAVPRKEMTWK